MADDGTTQAVPPAGPPWQSRARGRRTVTAAALIALVAVGCPLALARHEGLHRADAAPLPESATTQPATTAPATTTLATTTLAATPDRMTAPAPTAPVTTAPTTTAPAPTAPVTTGPVTSTGDAAACTAGDLSVREDEAAGGQWTLHRSSVYVVTNTSTAPCTLPSTPRLVARYDSGGPAPVPKVTPAVDATNHYRPYDLPTEPFVLGAGSRAGVRVESESGAAIDGWHSPPEANGWTGLALRGRTALDLWRGVGCADNSAWVSPFFDLRANPIWAIRMGLRLLPVDATAPGVDAPANGIAVPAFVGTRTDVDGDGRVDDVVVGPDGAISATLATGDTTAVEGPLGTDTLSAAPDLFNDGRHEVIVATTARGFYSWYTATVFRWADGHLVALRFPGRDDGGIDINSNQGVQCDTTAGTVAVVTVRGGAHAVTTRTSYRINGSSLVPAGRTQVPFDGNGDTDVARVWDVVHTRCRGMDAAGWAT